MTARQDGLDGVLGPLEQDVMDAAWSLGGTATVRDVFEKLAQGRKIAYTTVMTTMTRLADKGHLVKDSTGVAHVYSPARSRDDHARSTVSNVLGWLLDRYPEPAASYLASVADSADTQDVDALRAAVEVARNAEGSR